MDNKVILIELSDEVWSKVSRDSTGVEDFTKLLRDNIHNTAKDEPLVLVSQRNFIHNIRVFEPEFLDEADEENANQKPIVKQKNLKSILETDSEDFKEEEIITILTSFEEQNLLDDYITTIINSKNYSEDELFTIFNAAVSSDLDISAKWFKDLADCLQTSDNGSISHKVENIVNFYADQIYKGDNNKNE